MKQEVINELAKVCASFDSKSVMSDFEYDKKRLNGYDDEFAFVVYKCGTALKLLRANEKEINKYSIDRTAKYGFNFEYYSDQKGAQFFYYSDQKGLQNIKWYEMEYLSDNFANDCYEAHKEMLDSMRKKQKLYIKCSGDEFMRAYNLSLKHNDKTFSNCINRLISYAENTIDSYCELYLDFTKNSFNFSQIDYETKAVIMNGGIVFHGFPEEEGYITNGSVQISQSYGWQIHT